MSRHFYPCQLLMGNRCGEFYWFLTSPFSPTHIKTIKTCLFSAVGCNEWKYNDVYVVDSPVVVVCLVNNNRYLFLVIISLLRKLAAVQLPVTSSKCLYCTVRLLLLLYGFPFSSHVFLSFSTSWISFYISSWACDFECLNHLFQSFLRYLQSTLFAIVSDKYVIKFCRYLTDYSSGGLTVLVKVWSFSPASPFIRPAPPASRCLRFVPLVAFSLFLVSASLASNNLAYSVDHLSINILEPASAAILMESITSDVQPLPASPIVFSSVVVTIDLHPSSDSHCWKWISNWESHLGEPYQQRTCTTPMIAVLTSRRHQRDRDGGRIIISVTFQDKFVLFISVFQYSPAVLDRLDVRRSVLGMRLPGCELLSHGR